ncbi:Homeobox-leucine zipper protein HOX11 [Apostasia shenzhenica]|uniref:Homeobox-leucine zipper protein HOX11 n=1 Tax=Apostasia shenzhenica TaxID=1088818 RepID=A0A2I0A231_9ASPA|nr:Homeobox-leucine zipper protein HOX11 [Apostasia shenzhenica]
MELALCLGDSPAKALEKIPGGSGGRQRLGLNLGIGRGREEGDGDGADPLVQLNLLPLASVHRRETTPPEHPWSAEKSRNSEAYSTRGFDVNEAPAAESAEEGGAAASSSSRASDEEENGGPRKKLRLSKEQSAFLEQSFKEHNTLNPKEKLALARQLNLRPRQVEVWFQNRRARTKLKQTEVDCEYLKRCCETLKEENRRLQKELSELRALKTSQPFFLQLPATTLSMCPSCERVSSSSGVVVGGVHASGSGAPAAPDKPPVPPSAAGLFPKLPFASRQPSAAS